ncbi:MAG: TolC family protein [Chitinivibrionales bacterium]|nr:TolC family protein [Chitinivibrionales bacterium]
MVNKNRIFMIAAGGMFAALSASADSLSLNQYVALVLAHNPQPQIAASALTVTRAKSSTALAGMLPGVSANAGISKGSNNVTNNVGTSVSAGINAQMQIFDFGRTPLQYKAATRSVSAAQYDLQSTLQATILSARTAYFNYLLALQLLGVNQDALKQATAHYDQAKVLFEVGKQAKITVTKANVDVANAQVNLIHAQNALRLARVQLETTAGALLPDSLVLTDTLGEIEDSLALPDAMTAALEKRPDILSGKAHLDASRLQRDAAAAAFFPSVNGNAGYSWRGGDGNAFVAPDWNQPSWSVGANLTVPLFQGGAIAASFKQADATLAQTRATLNATTQNALQQVQQNYLQEIDARQRISATAVLVQQATEALQMSQERYRNGVAAPLEITDAELTLANARSSHYQAQYDYHIAHAQLLLATGTLHE